MNANIQDAFQKYLDSKKTAADKKEWADYKERNGISFSVAPEDDVILTTRRNPKGSAIPIARKRKADEMEEAEDGEKELEEASDSDCYSAMSDREEEFGSEDLPIELSDSEISELDQEECEGLLSDYKVLKQQIDTMIEKLDLRLFSIFKPFPCDP